MKSHKPLKFTYVHISDKLTALWHSYEIHKEGRSAVQRNLDGYKLVSQGKPTIIEDGMQCLSVVCIKLSNFL